MDERNRLPRIGVAFAIYLILAAVLPAADDEVYYWCWSKDLQWSYYDHPPMTAVLIWLSTSLFGDSFFGFRFPACIASAFVLYVIDRLTRSSPLMWGVAFSPMFTGGAVFITPDSPLVMFWAAYVWWLVELHQRMALDHESSNCGPQKVRLWYWILGGIVLGCGALSKYTMAIAVPSAFIGLLLSKRPWREWIGPYVFHGIIAFVVASPILIYNIGQNFEPLRFQWAHAAQKSPVAWRSFLDFVGVQIVLFGTLPFFLLPWVIANFRRLCLEPRLRVCTTMYVIPMMFFLYKSTQARLEGNWAFVCFVSFWPVAHTWFESVQASKFWRWSTASAFLPPAIAVVAIGIHLVCPIPYYPPKLDRVHRQIAINAATKEVAKRILQQSEALPVYTNSYQMTAWLRFHSLPALQIDQLTRPSHFTRPPHQLTETDRAYVVTNLPLPPEFAKGFAPPELIDSVPMKVRGEVVDTLNIRLYSKSPVGEQPENVLQ